MSEKNEDTEVSLDAIDAALGDLLKATDQTEIAKAYGGTSVDQGGHTDERGQTGGGYPGGGDVGGLDNMMIGKMQEALIDAGFSAEQVVAFMSGGDDEEEDADEEEEAPKMKGKAKKSETNDFEKSFREDSAIAEAIDVSPFLEALVQRTVEQIGGLAKSLESGQSQQQGVNQGLAKALYGVGQMVKGLQEHSHRLEQRLGMVERQPASPRGFVGERPAKLHAQAVRKSFGQHGFEGQPGEVATDSLTKSDVVRTLTYMNLEKGIKEIGGTKTSDLAGLIEGGGVVQPTAVQAAARFLAENPGEAATARSYR